MFKIILVSLFLLYSSLGFLWANFTICENNLQAEEHIAKNKDSLLVISFINAGDTLAFNLQAQTYKAVSEEAKKKKVEASFALVNYQRDKELKNRLMIRRLPHTVVLLNGIAVKSAFGILPEEAIWQLVTLTVGKEE